MQTFRRMGGARGNQTAACYNRSQLNSVCRRKPASIPSWGKRAPSGDARQMVQFVGYSIRCFLRFAPFLQFSPRKLPARRDPVRSEELRFSLSLLLPLASSLAEGVNKIGQANLERNLSGGVKSVFASSLRSVSLEEKSNSRDKRSQWAPTDK